MEQNAATATSVSSTTSSGGSRCSERGRDPAQTQQNKNDPELGIESVIPSAYKQGMKDLPKPHDIDSFNYMKVKVKELTTYVTGQLSAVAKKRIGFDTVDADWMGEWNLRKVIEIGRRPLGTNAQT